jgi:hypothetical protein
MNLPYEITRCPVPLRKRIRNFLHDLLIAITGMPDES